MPTIVPNSADQVSEVAAKLIAAAGGDSSRVNPITSGPYLAFEVDDDVFAALKGAPVDVEPDEEPADTPDPLNSPLPEPPDRNDSTAEWAEYLSAAPFHMDTAGKKRGALIDAYDAWLANHGDA
ncbi:hypothetical protein SEA_CLOWN_25 [Gordonia phage Clown]|uniref:Uncharacterized protein n=1 Tax=Gordonia phage Clown TaxID=2759393 RepID=A0A7L7SHW5_9CAUD|nr:hypothetical protein KNV25_gp25 [Gordonia phage Clown]QOC56023.1 hypothetical protein SEA_CLOWN_25 [Gordonia phage Clown]